MWEREDEAPIGSLAPGSGGHLLVFVWSVLCSRRTVRDCSGGGEHEAYYQVYGLLY